ncbi:MAG: LLM class flavin-dependent oxidoreductase [Gammaproteobacteria bacterium]|nr:LLM class flavin-dependent oxidoreductase [Gammaproteobacteria bacterium]
MPELKNFSLLDLAPITEGSDARQALLNSLDLARAAEQAGYKRFWMAEHHNMSGIASAATAVALGHVAAGTSSIRIGAAGVMLPNHSPLVIAEQYGTLASLYPERVDLGLGRAPGTDAKTLRALRRHAQTAADNFPEDVMELMAFFEDGNAMGVQAVPGRGLRVPIWILGSSLFGAQLAAVLGLPYIFAAHFAPDLLDQALQVYRDKFRPSAYHSEPYAAVAVNVFAADSDAEGEALLQDMQLHFAALRRGNPGTFKAPGFTLDPPLSEIEAMETRNTLRESAVGTKASVEAWFEDFLQRTRADELVLSCMTYEHPARLKSFRIAAEALRNFKAD